MNRFLFTLLLQLFFAGILIAQTPGDTITSSLVDSIQQKDTIIQNDPVTITGNFYPVSKRPVDSGWVIKPGISPSSPEFSWQILQHHPYFGFKNFPLTKPVSEIKQFNGKEFLFYLLIVLLIVFSLLRNLFPKYFSDLFRLFFRTTLKQRQIREQLMQTPLPSLLLNGFFVISAGLYIAFVFQYFNFSPAVNFWLLFLYSSIGLSVAYFIKFLGLKFAGWLFNVNEAANSYIFIVFIINKMIGILLLPFLVLLAFTYGNIYTGCMTISWCLVAALLIYRFILTYTAIHNEVKVNPFHFFLYLCAFEIAPLLLIYKGLLLFFQQTT